MNSLLELGVIKDGKIEKPYKPQSKSETASEWNQEAEEAENGDFIGNGSKVPKESTIRKETWPDFSKGKKVSLFVLSFCLCFHFSSLLSSFLFPLASS